MASLTSRIKSVSRVSTLWSLKCEAPTALSRSGSGRANPSMSSVCYDTGLLQSLQLVSCWYFPVLSVLSTQPQIVSVSGCPAEVIPLLERSCLFQKGIEYPFRFDALCLPDLMHERWGSVFGTISFFSQLKFLVTFLDGCGGQPWAALMPEFVKVRSLSVRL